MAVPIELGEFGEVHLTYSYLFWVEYLSPSKELIDITRKDQ